MYAANYMPCLTFKEHCRNDNFRDYCEVSNRTTFMAELLNLITRNRNKLTHFACYSKQTKIRIKFLHDNLQSRSSPALNLQFVDFFGGLVWDSPGYDDQAHHNMHNPLLHLHL